MSTEVEGSGAVALHGQSIVWVLSGTPEGDCFLEGLGLDTKDLRVQFEDLLVAAERQGEPAEHSEGEEVLIAVQSLRASIKRATERIEISGPPGPAVLFGAKDEWTVMAVKEDAILWNRLAREGVEDLVSRMLHSQGDRAASWWTGRVPRQRIVVDRDVVRLHTLTSSVPGEATFASGELRNVVDRACSETAHEAG